MSLSLVVLAAGIGSRFGGLKQMAPMGPSGEFIIDYALYDALRAGFDRVVFVIRRDIESDFRATIGKRAEGVVETRYVYQELGDLPNGRRAPDGREKPWGTGHATLAAAAAVDGPFAVINADDFYGAESYSRLATFLRETVEEETQLAMVGYVLARTLSEHGYVSRGICETDSAGLLQSVTEYTHIERTPDGIMAGERALTGKEIVSMNLWGFKPRFMQFLASEFECFLDQHGHELKAEFYVPAVVNTLLERGDVTCRVIETPAAWCGVTYPQEREAVSRIIHNLVAEGVYPTSLFGA